MHSDVAQPIQVDVEQRPDVINVSVTNRGTPIAPDMRHPGFEPFVRPDGSAPRPGLGLGLYIAAQIARSHEGTLSMTSSRERGTTSTLSMPTPRP